MCSIWICNMLLRPLCTPANSNWTPIMLFPALFGTLLRRSAITCALLRGQHPQHPSLAHLVDRQPLLYNTKYNGLPRVICRNMRGKYGSCSNAAVTSLRSSHWAAWGGDVSGIWSLLAVSNLLFSSSLSSDTVRLRIDALGHHSQTDIPDTADCKLLVAKINSKRP